MLKWIFVLSLVAGPTAAAQSAPEKYPACPGAELGKSDYKVTARHDDFEGTTSYTSSDIPLDQNDDDMQFKLKAFGFGKTEQQFALMAIYIGKSWVFINKDSPMRLLADGQSMSLAPVGKPTRDVWEGGEVYESLMYHASLTDIDAIAKAGSIRIRLNGDKYIPDLTLTKKGACGLARFLEERSGSAR